VTEAWNHEFMGNHPQPDDKMWGLISSSGTNYNHPQGRNVFPGGDRWCLIHISSFPTFLFFFGGVAIYIHRDIIWIELESTGNLMMVMNERVS
jgi:hypothetical protein